MSTPSLALGPLLLACCLGSVAFAQDEAPAPDAPTPASPDAGEESNAELLERIRQLEERVKGLEKAPKAEAEEPDDEEWALEEEPDSNAPNPEALALPPPTQGGHYGGIFGYGYRGGGLEFVSPYGVRARLSGEVRARGEYRDPADLRIPGQAGRPATDDSSDATDFALLRTRIKLDVSLHGSARAVIEIQDSRTFGDVEASTDRAELHLRQGFVELAEPFDQPLWLWVGRWAVPGLGSSRLFSTADFSNVTRSFDGVQVFAHFGNSDEDKPLVWLTAFAANVREGRVFSATADENDDFWVSGVYSTIHLNDMFEADLYAFWRHLSDRVFTSEKRARLGDRKDFTLGSLLHFRQPGLMGLTAEATWQYGDQAGDRVRAWATALRGWFQLDLSEESNVTFVAEYSYASGDRDPTDGKSQTFDPLFPLTQRFHGQSGLFVWRNVHNPTVGVRYTPFAGLTFFSDVHAFWLDKRRDAWYRVGGVSRRDTSGNSRSFVGYELDVYAIYQITHHLRASVGYSHFWAGPYARDTGKNNAGRGSGADQDWAYLQIELDF